MMKKLHLSRVLLMASLITFFAISCKKDQAADNPVEDAKSWYLKSIANAKSSLKSNRGTIQNITQDIQWNDAQLYTLEDGTDVLGAPVVITLDKGIKAKGSYMLLISKTNGVYSSLVAYNENKDYFNGNLTISAVQKIYKNTLELSLAHKDMSVSTGNSNPNNKLMTVPAEGYCIDWYLTTYLYDEWGNIVQILSEIYLYTTCTEEGGGGGGGTPPVEPEFIPEFGIPVSDAQGSGSEQFEVIGVDTFKVATRDWKFHEGYTWYGKSTERLVAKSTNGQRTWAGLTHVDNIRGGIWIAGKAEIFATKFTPTITVGSTSVATMEAKYRIRLTPLQFLTEYESDYYYSYANWDINFNKTF